jgi:AmmeMemoRadiSam system protein A
MNLVITQDEQRALLADARETIAATLENRLPVYPREPALKEAAAAGTSALSRPCGAFVTIRREGRLRGCIGRMDAAEPLEKTVRLMATEAAFGDPRFSPLTKDEFARCSLEISALSPMDLCEDPRSVQVGVHGLYISHQWKTGVLLPQVPVEQGWDLDEYLDQICVKAGLRRGAYRERGAKLYTFTAVVFGEP